MPTYYYYVPQKLVEIHQIGAKFQFSKFHVIVKITNILHKIMKAKQLSQISELKAELARLPR